ncbi:hypothetical protein ACFSYD_09695 [Paracoccus aerius]
MDQQAFEQRFAGAYGPDLQGEARLNEAWRMSDIVEVAAQIDPTPFRRVPRLYLDLASGDPFFEGNAAAHVALDRAGSCIDSGSAKAATTGSSGGTHSLCLGACRPIFARQYGE